MPRHNVADSVHGQQVRIVVLAQKSSPVDALARQLETFDCAVEHAETLAEAQSMATRGMPHFAFIQCLQFSLHLREIVGLLRESSDSRPSRPWLVGIGCEHCPSEDLRACGLDDYLRLPPDPDELKVLLGRHDRGLEDPAVGAAEHPGHCRELSVSEAVSQLPEDVQTAMLTAFVEHTVTLFVRIESGLSAYEFSQVTRDLHAVKSGCLQMGFSSMANCCEEMRRAIEANDVGTAQLCFRALTAAFNEIASALPRN